MADKTSKTEPEIAREYQKGPAMDISRSSGFSGGVPETNNEKQNQRNLRQAQLSEKRRQQPNPEQNKRQPMTQNQMPSQLGQDGGLMNRMQNRYDQKVDKELDAGNKSPVAQNYRSYKRDLNGERGAERKKGLLENQKKKIVSAVTRPSREGTGHLLKLAWLNLLDTIGLSWFYIAFHFLMAYFTPLSSLFCKFGEEWLPKQVGAAGGEAAKGATKTLEMVEIAGCFLVGLIILSIITLAVIIIAILGYAYTHKLDFLIDTLGGTWAAIKCIGGYTFGVGTCGSIPK